MKAVKSHSVDETYALAKSFAETVKPGDVVCLNGTLGAGKTHFVKGFVEAFGISIDEVQSPTFTIINEYHGDIDIYHFDCYRLEHFQEAVEIGAEEYLYGSGVCIIEWPERIHQLIPQTAKKISLNITGPEERELIFQNNN